MKNYAFHLQILIFSIKNDDKKFNVCYQFKLIILIIINIMLDFFIKVFIKIFAF